MNKVQASIVVFCAVYTALMATVIHIRLFSGKHKR